ncbi:hypothetical protein Dtox_2511 [Desulfofarcimen acetoxidans DSM 771]|uniref:Conjugative transposon protein TcpC n=1 Tax=Desulfofarcimen acetoxidans (strain ATCC 49208 / DSM 771 / KCTC 5769 / VKM B-1644 / 5575) TaxID=485916 RepID=C8W0R1_DESAS|nr:conjugal transfer protein [Desulfofarcimen acetoxidans]ACV63316.1 hypothetical protein Dtox_2511 [Desulfofarcimen acetoxidans DSM 771]
MRRLIYRWTAAGLLWLLIIIVVITSIRSVNIVNKVSQVAKNAMTEQNEQVITNVRDTAKAFATEWATFNGNNNEYNSRLGTFLNKTSSIIAPVGIQEVMSSSLLASESKNSRDYRVKILLHVRRLSPVEGNTNVPSSLIPVTRDDLVKIKDSQYDIQLPAIGWQNYLLFVEVPVTVINNQPVIKGLPVIVSNNNKKGEISQPKQYDGVVTPDFATFINQFMSMYFTGQALSNFIMSGSNIQPINGWNLLSIDEIKTDSEKPTKACVRVTVSTAGIEKITQIIYIKVQAVRGSYLIEDLGSLPE